MVKVTVQTRHDGLISRETLEVITFELARAIIPPHLKGTIRVAFRQPEVVNAGSAHERWGFCNMKTPGQVRIVVDKRRGALAIRRTVAHELQHARQFLEKTLVFVPATEDKPPHWLWKGLYVRVGTPYENRPWENEAREVEAQLG